MKTFRLQITTPAGAILDSDAVQLSVRAVDGEMAVMAGHIPFCTATVPAECRVYDADGNMRRATVGSGILSVTCEKTQLLTSSFKWNE
ncbi:MAG: F0F1 ATP synthase subunit epsilon [Clostridia bacterium]|nr:F0F1 ATP synthase subunit epsilon [Clostridia bacterium]